MNKFSVSLAALLVGSILAACGGKGNDSDNQSSQQSPMTLAASRYATSLPACPAPDHALHDISAVQGNGPLSPLVGQQVAVRGVVVGDFQKANQLKGFFIQQPVPDNDKTTSDGVFVYAPANDTPVRAGDYVQVSGTVDEFKSGSTDPDRLTQIGRVTQIATCGTGIAIKPVNITLPVMDASELEAVEGMLVRFMQPLYVSETYRLGRYGELLLSSQSRLYHPNNHPTNGDAAAVDERNQRTQIVLDDGLTVSNPNPIPHLSAADASGTRRVGDVVKGVEGIVAWAFDAYRIQPTQQPVFTPANARTEAPAPVGGTIRAGSLNVLNYFTTLNQRGANSSVEFQRQKDKLVTTIAGLDADVLGLMEIENNGATALQDLVAAVNQKMGANTYAAINAGVPGTDAITVAIIYKPAKVRPIGNAVIPEDARFAIGGSARPPVAQHFAARDNQGSFWLAVNHFKSKGSCPRDPDSVNRDTGQGCWNVARVAQADALKDWVAQLTTQSGEADVLLVGDFNAYLNEDPIKSIEAGRYENLLKRLPATDRYSYVFKGQSGALDHAFASESLQSQIAGVTVWHINADEPVVLDYNTEFKTDDRYAVSPFRSSDHDPVLVGLTLTADAPASAPTLDAMLPTAGQAGTATVIHSIAATLSDTATSGTLTIDWGDGTATQTLALNATSTSHTYAVAGSYTARLRLTESTGKTAELVTRIQVAPAADPATGSVLFFSEYVEGSSNNKALEIYNPTASAVDLAGYQIKLYSNGATAPTSTHNLSGTLNAGATLVLVNAGITPSAVISGMKITSATANFNGDDAVTLVKDGVVIDAIGQVGFDPGVEWVRGDISTLNKTLRRKADVVRGSIPPQAPAEWDVAVEWDAYPIDTFSGLGTR